ncbi:MAG: hypothetical protein ABR606_05570 [Vicinamibacterales bacterium]
MTPLREAVLLPLLFLTVALAGGLRLDASGIGTPPSLFSLVLAVILCVTLVQSGTVAPERLMSASRSSLANLNGLVVLFSLVAASAQALSLVMPASGLPAAGMGLVLLILLVQMLATSLDRERLLRAMMVTLGAGFTLKFIVLAGLSSPADSSVARALQVLFDNVTLGTIAQAPLPRAQGYLAFGTLALYLIGLWLLPSAGWYTVRAEAMLLAGSADDRRLEE